MLIKEANITIMVKNMDRSINFYLALGFSLKSRWENYYAQLEAPGVLIGLHPSTEENKAGNISIGFTTDNFEEAKSFLSEHLIETELRSEEGGEFIHFNDPDGTPLYFIKPKW
jgi:catechol 2,3-dioxygenase-like lactoylglutathione lyase family enzyme